jgi:hypothetical protein
VKGGERLLIDYVITMDEVRATLQRQGIGEPGEGDAVLFRTGHGKLWKKDNAEYNKGGSSARPGAFARPEVSSTSSPSRAARCGPSRKPTV